MEQFRRGRGCSGTAASTVRLVVVMTALLGGVGDPIPTGKIPPVSTNRCSGFDLSGLTNAMNCGSPLSAPCFDFSRCRDGPTVYVYDRKCSLADSTKQMQMSAGLDAGFRRVAKHLGVLAETYESACFFISVDGKDEPQCPTKAPLWNEGRNHVMFDLGFRSREHRTSYSGSYAIQAATSQHSCYYRSGYDISVAHCPNVVFHELHSTPAHLRRYFLTFRGSMHLEGHGSEERTSILGLHDDAAGVVVAEKCRAKATYYFPEYAEYCAGLLPRFNDYDYADLMNSTFGLVPAGTSPGSFRLGEVLSAGCIPVIIARDYVKPFTEEVDWSTFSFTFTPDEVPHMIRTLRAVPPEELRQMQEKTLDAYWKIYGGATDYSLIIYRVIDTLVRRIGHREH